MLICFCIELVSELLRLLRKGLDLVDFCLNLPHGIIFESAAASHKH